MAEEKIVTPLKAIRRHCLDCSCWNTAEVRNCTVTECDLYPFRMGHNPNRKGKGGKSSTPNSVNDSDPFMDGDEEIIAEDD